MELLATVGGLMKEDGYWVPKKRKGKCIYYRKDCSVQTIKPVDCLIYPIDPVYTLDRIDFVIDLSCPAAESLSVEFMAEAMIRGKEWLLETSPEAFMNHWKKYKEHNPHQELVPLMEYLNSAKSAEFKFELARLYVPYSK